MRIYITDQHKGNYMNFITLDNSNIKTEHICCAFSDKKCIESYEKKKRWLKQEFDNGYTFYRLDERAKVFIEYGPAEKAWLPITADNFLNINCFWVSGKYKKSGLGKILLQKAIDDAKRDGKNGLVTVVGKKKYHFMSDGKWFMKQGLEIIEETKDGFVLLVKYLKDLEVKPKFNACAVKGECPEKKGLVAYFSNRCPYSEFHVKNSLLEIADKRNIPLKIIDIKTLEQAKKSPTPATIFSLFYNGQFLTTDLSICLESRFDKFWKKNGLSV
jgi:predicted GNAT family acetyltransferase